MKTIIVNEIDNKYLEQVNFVCNLNSVNNGGKLVWDLEKLKTLADYFILALSDEDELMGYLAFENKNNAFTIWQIVVNDNFRGQGVSIFMLEQLKAFAIEQNIEKLISACDKTNVPSLNMHLKFGFVINRVSETKNHFELPLK